MSWFSPNESRKTEIIYYDGECGFCHYWVRFVLSQDSGDEGFLFSPLQATSTKDDFESILVKRADGTVLEKSEAVLHILSSLGGIWKILASPLQIVPRSLSNLIYSVVARVRRKLISKPQDLCPVLPPNQRKRFLLNGE